MAEYRYYLIPDAMTRAFPEQFEKQTPTEFFDNIADLEKRYHQLREMPYNNERTWNERARFPYARLVVGVDRQNPDGAVAIVQVRNGVNYLCDDYRGPYADGSDAQIPQMAKKLVEVIGVDRVRPHTYTQRDGYTWVQVEKDMHITEWLYAHELCSSLQFTRFLNRDGRKLFQVRDGQRVIETNADGTKRIRAVKSIDVTHAYVGHYGCHIQQYAEDNFRTGCYVAPEHPQPGDNLDKLQIYQITKGGCEYRFMNYAYSKSRIHAADYSSVYIANLPADYDLDRCFQEFNAPNRPLRYHMYLQRQIDDVIDQIALLKSSRAENFTIKQMERTRKQLKKKLDKLNDQQRKDDVVTFEDLGVDSLMVDEAHYFKNAMIATKMRNVAGISQTESQKSSDMLMKCMYLDEVTGGHGIVFATGTPISNSMTEMYVMMRYLQRGLLEKEGLLNFDSWASTFGESITAIELNPTGTGYRTKTRFARFYNLPELMSLFKMSADIQTADMLHLPVPELVGGKPTNVVLQPSEVQKRMVKGLADRAEKVRSGKVQPTEDNMLRITNDGRKLALDQRLMNPLLPDDPGSKANACVDKVYEIWEKTKEQRSTQMIFCDLSTPKEDGFDVYNDVRDKLVAKGIPKEEVQFIHDADTETKKAELFGKVRNGTVRVLMGSTQKMGAGTNVQTRLIALHHLDCPWRPADIAQRNGRMVRQGNLNKEVSIFIYVTESTFDSYSWQLVENKQKFISQIMTSKSPARSCEDLDEAALTYAEVKALAAGNPMIKEKMDLDIQVARLRTLKAVYTSQHYRLEDAIAVAFPRQIKGTEHRIRAFEQDIQTAKEHQSYDADKKLIFSIELDGKTYDKREDAGKALLGLVGAAVRATKPVLVGHYAGFEITVEYKPLEKVFHAHLVGEATHTTELGNDAAGNMIRFQNVVSALPQDLNRLHGSLEQLTKQLTNAEEELKQPFLQEQELSDKSARLAELDALLNVGNDAPIIEGEAEELEEEPEDALIQSDDELER